MSTNLPKMSIATHRFPPVPVAWNAIANYQDDHATALHSMLTNRPKMTFANRSFLPHTVKMASQTAQADHSTPNR